MNQDYKCCSILAPYIEGLIQERRKLGFSYQFEEYLLKVFDDYCVSKKLQKADFNKEFLSDWLKRKDSESSSYHSQNHYAFASLEQLRLAMQKAETTETDSLTALWKGHEDELSNMCGLRK